MAPARILAAENEHRATRNLSAGAIGLCLSPEGRSDFLPRNTAKKFREIVRGAAEEPAECVRIAGETVLRVAAGMAASVARSYSPTPHRSSRRPR